MGLSNRGAINKILNNGTIIGGTTGRESIENGGSIVTLINAQGQGNGAGALTYAGFCLPITIYYLQARAIMECFQVPVFLGACLLE